MSPWDTRRMVLPVLSFSSAANSDLIRCATWNITQHRLLIWSLHCRGSHTWVPHTLVILHLLILWDYLFQARRNECINKLLIWEIIQYICQLLVPVRRSPRLHWELLLDHMHPPPTPRGISCLTEAHTLQNCALSALELPEAQQNEVGIGACCLLDGSHLLNA